MTKFLLAEQIRRILGNKITQQELELAVNQGYAYIVRTNWWNNKNAGENDINGNFIYAFDDNEILLDTNKKLYYSVLPSTFLGNIPHEMGIPHVSYQQSVNKPFIRLTNGYPALFQGLQSSNFDGYDTFFVENDRIYLPTINTTTACDRTLLIKLVIGLQDVDDQETISIPPDLQAEIVAYVVQMYSQQRNEEVIQSAQVEQGKKAF